MSSDIALKVNHYGGWRCTYPPYGISYKKSSVDKYNAIHLTSYVCTMPVRVGERTRLFTELLVVCYWIWNATCGILCSYAVPVTSILTQCQRLISDLNNASLTLEK